MSALRRWLLEPWVHQDTKYYVSIAERGYRLDDGTAQFHPLYPWLGRVVGTVLGGNMLLGLLVVSSLCTLGALALLYRLALLDTDAATARRATLFLALTPAAVMLFAPYTEPLFLLCSIGCLLLARQGRWWWAGLAGGLAALTRQQGIFLLVPLAYELWVAAGGRWRALVAAWRRWLALGLVPAGLLVWLVYRAVALGDVALDWHEPRTLIYSFLISRSSAKVVPQQGFVWPWVALTRAVRSVGQPGSLTTVLDLTFGGVALLFAVVGARQLWRLRPSYLLYTATILLVSFSYYTGRFYPYMGLPRHCLLAFPLVLPMAQRYRLPIIGRTLLLAGLLGMLFLLMVFSFESWIP